MIIERINIKKFRGFDGVGFELGTNLTVIAGQNGTQKTTLLGILSQPFSITKKDHPFLKEKPLCGGNFRSQFSDKFKISDKFDKAGEHEWELDVVGVGKFPVESIKRDDKNPVRFWKKGDKGAGSGYIQRPVIFLSLKRLIPIGEESDIGEDTSEALTAQEIDFYKKWHNKILLLLDEVTDSNLLSSKNKNTIGAETVTYDWMLNSAGQDNVGKIILAVLSFKRLKENYPNDYKGGLLVIDELDATLYPAAQLKLIELLRKFSSQSKIQIIFSTHSLTILQKMTELQNQTNIKRQNKVIYLEKLDGNVGVLDGASYNTIKNRLNVTINPKSTSKIEVFTEDAETLSFARALLKRKTGKLQFNKCSIGCDALLDLAGRKIPSFSFPNSIIILDGDVRSDPKKIKKIEKLKNILILPTSHSPEQILAEFLNGMSDTSDIWYSVNPDYNKQFCFKDVSKEEIMNDRKKAKTWYLENAKNWGRNATKVINPWIKENPGDVELFVADFKTIYNRFAKEFALPPFK